MTKHKTNENIILNMIVPDSDGNKVGKSQMPPTILAIMIIVLLILISSPFGLAGIYSYTGVLLLATFKCTTLKKGWWFSQTPAVGAENRKT